MQPAKEAYEAAARHRGVDGVVEALIARANQRWDNVRSNIRTLGEPATETLHILYPIDVVLWRAGVRFNAFPASPYGTWAEHLRWGTDSACQVQRMVLAGNLLGAAVIARTQLERWTLNRATSNGFDQREGTSTAEFYSEVWSQAEPHPSAGEVWQHLSEILHGRGDMLGAARWESQSLCAPANVATPGASVDLVQTATQLALGQIRNCATTEAESLGFPLGFVRAVRALPSSLPAKAVIARDAVPMLWPMTFTNVHIFGPRLSAIGRVYREDVEGLSAKGVRRPLDYSARGIEALGERRGRAADSARSAFEAERDQLGDQFDPTALTSREFAYLIVSETAGLLSCWTSGPRSDALAVGGSALRAAFWLWLEDDDRALVLGRTVLEQTARLRAWRNKPGRAQKIEERGMRASTRDWLDAAGWRRLSILNRSLGEFAHADPQKTHWYAARETLALLEPPGAPSLPVDRTQTARGDTLAAIMFAFGAEVVGDIADMSQELADALGAVLPRAPGDATSGEIDKWLERCWTHRGRSFGATEFTISD